MGKLTKRVEGELRIGSTLTAKIKRKGKRKFGKSIILKGRKKDDRRKA